MQVFDDTVESKRVVSTIELHRTAKFEVFARKFPDFLTLELQSPDVTVAFFFKDGEEGTEFVRKISGAIAVPREVGF